MSNFLLLNYEFPPLGGGAGTATQAIAKELVLLGHNVRVVTTWFTGESEKEIVDGYTVVRLKSRRKKKEGSNVIEMLSYVLWAILYFSKKTNREEADFVISFFAIPSGVVALYLKYRFRLRYIVSLRGGDVPGFLPSSLAIHHFLTSYITKLVWRNADFIVANSAGLQKLANKTGVKIKKEVLYIPNGVDTEKFTPKTDASEENNQISLLFVGRLSPQKGLDKALRALSELGKLSPKNKYTFTIVGDGPLRGELEEEAKIMDVSEMCSFFGWMDREKLSSEYQKHDVFLLPSLDEGMPNVVLEAMASGLAIVASNIPGTDELVRDGENGFLISEDSKYSEAILRLAEDKELLNTFQNKSRDIAKEFDWKKVAEKYVELWSKQ